jgi:hypothetical protein
VEVIQTGTLDPMKLQLSVDIMQSGMDLPSLLKTYGTPSSPVHGSAACSASMHCQHPYNVTVLEADDFTFED